MEQEGPFSLTQLLQDESWLEKFCTYKQLKSILHQMKSHSDPKPVKLVIEADAEQNFVTVQYSSGEEYTF